MTEASSAGHLSALASSANVVAPAIALMATPQP